MINLNANQIEITTTVQKADFFGGSGSNYIKKQSTTHLASNIEGTNVAINASGITTIKGSNVSANESLNITAAKIDILAVNDSSYAESKSSSKGFLSKKTTTTKKATSTNIATNLSGGNITLTTTTDGIDIIGSSLSAKEGLTLDNAGDLNIQAGYDGAMDESHTELKGTEGLFFERLWNVCEIKNRNAKIA